jgi:hypothetical protein
MQNHYHAIVWIDHREAKIFHVSASDVDRLVVYSHGGGQNLHHKANSGTADIWEWTRSSLRASSAR